MDMNRSEELEIDCLEEFSWHGDSGNQGSTAENPPWVYHGATRTVPLTMAHRGSQFLKKTYRRASCRAVATA